MAEDAKQLAAKHLNSTMTAFNRRETMNHLDTSHFNETISAFGSYISQFEDIIRGIHSATDRMGENWEGRGCKAFGKDCRQVQLNLKDISDIMYELRDALIDAHAEYIKTDAALAKSMES